MTPQTDAMTLVRDRVAEDPSVMLASLADELGLPEAEVVRHLPEDMRVQIPAADFADVWEAMTGWEKITFIARNDGAVVEYCGKLPRGRFGHGMFNLMDKDSPLGGHLFADRLGSIWMVSKPFFKLESHSVQFFDKQGRAMFSVYAGRDDKRAILPSVLEAFMALRRRYAGEVQ